MKVATITVNPAVDETISVDNFKLGTVNRSQGYRYDAGGKGVNVASFLADYGIPVTVTGFLGEENADVFERHFSRKNIEDRFVRVPGETRVNIKIMDEVNQATTDLNMPGQVPGEYAISRLMEQVEAMSEACECFVLSGNIQSGLPIRFYADIIQLLKSKKRRVVLDTSGDALAESVKVRPNIIKPNIHELSALVNKPLDGIESIYSSAISMINEDTTTVVVSMGRQGALFVEKDQAFIARPPDVAVKSTVGAGDAMVAGLVAGLSKKISLRDCARLATAFSLSMITRLGRDLPEQNVIDDFQKQVEITPFVFGP
ncbi:MAG: 1-phosphofructokinase [Chloroflexi bacterium]|nr:1-phosphofructokinase [Chloroflexota bacterium]MBI3167409.1 1-phosphofructokinase [Chloroflexota bacterium]